jgi:hypothetical protein
MAVHFVLAVTVRKGHMKFKLYSFGQFIRSDISSFIRVKSRVHFNGDNMVYKPVYVPHNQPLARNFVIKNMYKS